MKKLIYCAAALATALFAGSCQQELLDTPAGETTFTYSVEIPEAMTKAIGDGTNVNNLFYEVWITKTENDQTLDGAVRLYHKNIEMVRESGKTSRANVTLNLVQNQFYTILFWAQCGNARQGVYDVTNLTEVTYKENVEYKSNKEMYAAFYAVDYASDKTPRSKKVLLKRPFAQINLGTTNDVPADEYTVAMTASSVTVKNVPTTFNVATSAVSEVVDEFTFALSEDLPTEPLVAGGKTYDYAAMNYIFAGGNIELDYTINTMLTPTAPGSSKTPATITRTIPNVPVKENYRTNIVGSLLTNHSTYEVIVDASWNDFEGGNMVQLGDGIVVNLNGDYEVSNENGLAYAIENLFAQGGNFYLTAELYDMTDYDVTAPSVPDDVTLNIYGETPVVTRSATASFAGVTIIGLDSIIDVISEDANVSISGVELTDDGSVLVGTNNGTLVVSESTGEENIVGAGEMPIKADDVQDVTTLNAALASAVKTINITKSFEAEDVILVGRSVVINGNNNTFTTSANRAFLLKESDIEVIINDLKIVSTAVMVYPSDVRGVNIDAGKTNIALTLNNCSIDFTDKTTNDWTYAVNVAGNGTGHKVTVNGGSYEGANVINVHSAKNVITVKNAVLNCLYPFSEYYSGACIWVLQNQGSSVYAEGNTFNGNNAIAFNLGTGTALEEKDNIDNTMYYSNGIYYVTSVEKLQAAINNAKAGENTIAFSNDITGNVTVVQKPGVKITIDGCDKKYNGFIKVHSNSNHYADAALTIKKVKFETSTVYYDSDNEPYFNFIEALENGAERYSTNITVDNCTFTATGDAINEAVALQIKSSKWAKALNCTTTGLHSLIQAQSCDETVVVNGCTINGKNGVAFKQVKSATVEGTTITALEYGIRFDGNTANYGIVLKNNNVTAYQPLIVRKMTGANNTITLEGENTLTTDEIYQIVITNGSDDADYVKPSGTYTLTGADDFVVYPLYMEISDGLFYNEGKKNYDVANAAGLVALSTTTIKEGQSVSLIADIDLTDVEFNGLNAFNPENNNTFDGQGHTVSNWTYTGKADDMGFIKNWVGPIKNLTIKNAVLRTGGRSAVIAAKPYGNIENCHVVDCDFLANYWACGLIAGMHNSGNMKNCTATNSSITSTGGTGAITGVLNETSGTRTYEGCEVTGCTINNGGDDPYAGAAIVGLINIDNVTVQFINCAQTNNTFIGTAKDEFVGYNAGDNTTVTIE